MDYHVYVTDRMKDVSKVIDYLIIMSPPYVTSYFGWGDTNRNSS